MGIYLFVAWPKGAGARRYCVPRMRVSFCPRRKGLALLPQTLYSPFHEMTAQRNYVLKQTGMETTTAGVSWLKNTLISELLTIAALFQSAQTDPLQLR